MSNEIGLILADRPGPEEFLQLVVDLGGVYRPDEWTDGRLSRDDRHVWVQADDDGMGEFEPEQVLHYEEKLGSPMGQVVVLSISRTEGSDLVALEIIEAAVKRGWRLIIEDFYGNLLTVEQVRAIAAARPPYGLFDKAADPRWDVP